MKKSLRKAFIEKAKATTRREIEQLIAGESIEKEIRQELTYNEISLLNSIMPYEEWKKHEAKRRGILIGRFGKAEEVAPMVSLLLSPLSSYITGASVDIAGGLICPS